MKFRKSLVLFNTIAALGLAMLLVACGGGDGGSDSSTGTLNLAITDASVDAAKAVVVEFTGVELQHSGGERIDYDFVDGDGDPESRQIDLLALTGGTTELLLEDVTLTAGDYSWIRLKVNAQRGVLDSYIDLLDDSRHSLHVPSGANSGLKLNRGFNIPDGGMASFTIDFDLRRSVHNPSGSKEDYILRPTLRLVDGNTDGALSGTVTGIENDPDCSDNTATTATDAAMARPATGLNIRASPAGPAWTSGSSCNASWTPILKSGSILRGKWFCRESLINW